jgi:hypothetical protein
MIRRAHLAVVLAVFAIPLTPASAQQPARLPDGPARPAWRFVVSGDSRNCGDVVMPGIEQEG